MSWPCPLTAYLNIGTEPWYVNQIVPFFIGISTSCKEHSNVIMLPFFIIRDTALVYKNINTKNNNNSLKKIIYEGKLRSRIAKYIIMKKAAEIGIRIFAAPALTIFRQLRENSTDL